jgi:hypothetical protein
MEFLRPTPNAPTFMMERKLRIEVRSLSQSKRFSVPVGDFVYLTIELLDSVEYFAILLVLVSCNMFSSPLKGRLAEHMPYGIGHIKGISSGVRNKPFHKYVQGGFIITSNMNRSCSNRILEADHMYQGYDTKDTRQFRSVRITMLDA